MKRKDGNNGKKTEKDQRRNGDQKRRKHFIYLLWHLGMKAKMWQEGLMHHWI